MLSSVALRAGELLTAALLAGVVLFAVAAAEAALGSSSRLAASGLTDDVHREAMALAAGMASAARAAAPGGLPGGPA